MTHQQIAHALSIRIRREAERDAATPQDERDYFGEPEGCTYDDVVQFLQDDGMNGGDLVRMQIGRNPIANLSLAVVERVAARLSDWVVEGDDNSLAGCVDRALEVTSERIRRGFVATERRAMEMVA